MTTKEFITTIERLGYYAEESEDMMHIQDSLKRITVASISRTREFSFEVSVDDCKYSDIDTKYNLLRCVGAYVSTPIQKREKITEYYLRLKGTEIPSVPNAVYLNFKRRSGYYFTSNRDNTKEYKATFTQKEIDKLPRKLIQNFEKVEVEDENK